MQSKSRIEKIKEVNQLLSGKRQPKCWIVFVDENGNILSCDKPGYPEEYTEEDTAFLIRPYTEQEMKNHRKSCGINE
jgi:hypothetical protein